MYYNSDSYWDIDFNFTINEHDQIDDFLSTKLSFFKYAELIIE